MKKIILITVLLSLQIFATDWYLSPNGNNGTANSWATAKTTYSGIPWSSLNPGDHLYIDGGVTSITYTGILTVGKSGTAGNYIYILPGKYSPSPSGHSGRVILNANNGAQSINVTSKNYVYIKGFECTNGTMGIYIQDNSDGNVVDSNYIYDFHDVAGIFLNGNQSTYTVKNTILKNNTIISPAYYNGQTDCIYMQGCQKTLIYNNYTHARNQDETNHNDNIQSYHCNGFIVYNNICINDSVYSTEGGGTPIMIGSEGNNPVILYNNFLYMGGIWYSGGSQNSALWLRWYDVNPMPPYWAIHNTIVVNGPRCRDVIEENYGTLINNVIAMYSTSSTMANIEQSFIPSILVDSTRNNFFTVNNANTASFAGQFTGNGHTGSATWSSWFSTYGGTGSGGNPQFVNNFRYEPDQSVLLPDLKSTSPCIDAGNNVENIESYVDWLNVHWNLTGEWALPKTDIHGTPRGLIWDLGAFEFPEDYIPPVPAVKTIRVRVINQQ